MAVVVVVVVKVVEAEVVLDAVGSLAFVELVTLVVGVLFLFSFFVDLAFGGFFFLLLFVTVVLGCFS